METVAQEALRLLKEVPEDRWLTEKYTDYKGKMCANGHYVRLKLGFDPKNADEAFGLYEKWNHNELQKAADAFGQMSNLKMSFLLEGVNNIKYADYNEDTIKARVIHLLEDMVAAGY